MKKWGIALLGLAPVAHCVRHSMIVRANEIAAVGQVGTVSAETGTKASVSAMVNDMVQKRSLKVKDIIHSASKQITMDEAVEHLEKDLPPDVASLVRLTKTTKLADKASPFDEASIQKARRILNGMIETAWLELDDVLFESKEFEERNRGTYEQVVNDLSRLGSQLSALEEKRMAANSAISAYDTQRTVLDEAFNGVHQSFLTMKNTNQAELTRRKNDLAVFDFILNMTRCKEGQKFMQMSVGTKSVSAMQTGGNNNGHRLKVCSTSDGITLNFHDAKLQHRIEKMMTPDARMALRAALGQVAGKLNLIQGEAANTTSSNMVAVTVPVTEDPHPDGQWKKCVDGEENCGLLHDLMSLEWGKFRDEVDELTATMLANQQQFDNQQTNYNQQCAVVSDAKTKAETTLADAVSNINADTEEMNEKDEQKGELTAEFNKEMAIFRAKISEILHTKICAVRKVRNGICAHSSTSPPAQISDCDVSDWASKTGECFAPNGNVITCDDTCPQPDPYQCGGEETMKRDVVVLPNEFGMICPPLERQKRCGQKKCEVNCEMSQWSSWSACSKDCEGGVEVKTRSILTKPKHGGQMCDAVQEEQPCNTGSCDRNCQLDDWTAWDFCSMACGSGTTTRTRSVLIPIRGQGVCPTPQHADRLEEESCNTHDCTGDEICIAKQDLVIAMDASGSLKQGGFEIIRNFTANLTSRYEAEYFGAPAVKMGAVLFGNGYLIFTDGVTTISSAEVIEPLTNDFAAVRTKIMATEWQRGFTNMAQAFAKSEVLLAQNGRADAQSAVLVISDGRYSMRYQTMEKARELKDKNIKVLMAVVTDWSGADLEPLEQVASSPPATNFHHIPGLAALKANIGLYVDQLIAKFCPDATSPSAMQSLDVVHNYMLIHEGGSPDFNCAKIAFGGKLNSADECAEATREKGWHGFTFGTGNNQGICIIVDFKDADQAFWDTYLVDRENPPCPGKAEGGNGGWTANPFTDTYVVDPASLGIQ